MSSTAVGATAPQRTVRPPLRTEEVGPARLLILLVGAGLLLGALPVGASTSTASAADARQDRAGRALLLLSTAARAARTLSWTGTEYVSSWAGGTATRAVLTVRHDPRTGTSLQGYPGAGRQVVVPPTALQESYLDLLAQRYLLNYTVESLCNGRSAYVVEVSRRRGSLAARFWLDQETGLVLQREVFDRSGRKLRSSTVTGLAVAATATEGRSIAKPTRWTRSERSAGAELDLGALEAKQGWSWPRELAGGFVLVGSRRVAAGGTVVHLSYSDGLSTVSLFSQPGALSGAPTPGFTIRSVSGTAVQVRTGPPDRLLWSGGGQTFTLIGDAGPDELLSMVKALPHDDVAAGPRARLRRGLARVGSWLPLG